MRNNLFYSLILFLFLIFIYIDNVFAGTDGFEQQYVENGSALLLCEYENSDGTIESRIYYKFKLVSNPSMIEIWSAYYKSSMSNSLITLDSAITNEAMSLGEFNYAFATNSKISYQEEGERFDPSFANTFTCPYNMFIDRDMLDEICYGDWPSCGSKYESGPYSLNNNEKTIFNIIDNYANETVYNYITFEEWKSLDLLELIKSKTLSYIISKYEIGTTYVMPAFIQNYINNISDHIDATDDSNYNKFIENMQVQIKQAADSNTITEEEREILLEKASETMFESLGASICAKPGNNPMCTNASDDPNCKGLLGPQMTEIVNNIFKFIRYLAPVLVAVLTIVDFIKVATSGDQELMKKSTNKFVKRVICAILLFFVPLICQMLFSVAGITVPETCIK